MTPTFQAVRTKQSRRQFLQAGALAAGAITLGFPALVRGQNLNSKLNIAVIGAGGKGASDTDCCRSENIFALCDADRNNAAKTLAKYPDAKFYQNYRHMLEELGKSIDGVNVATPDHFHAIAATAVMDLGKPVYCQKPLCQTIWEARELRTMAVDRHLVTQMGNQGSAEDGLRRGVEAIQAGVIGQVREVHIWTNRPIWPTQGIERPAGEDPIPAGLDWDLWLGPAPVRPYKAGMYDPFNWRGWLDFGTGALGDMACHTVNLPFRGLHLGYPTEIEATCSGVTAETYPLSSKIRFEFPRRKFSQAAAHPSLFHHEDSRTLDPVTLWWYDGGNRVTGRRGGAGGHDGSNKPPVALTAEVAAFRGEVPGSGCLLIGDEGTLFSPDDYGTEFYVKLKGEAKFTHYSKHPGVLAVPQSIPRNPFKGDADTRHHLEWLAAIKSGKPEGCYSRFDIGGRLAEIMLLGCVALRTGKVLHWDGPKMRVTNVPEAARFIRRVDRVFKEE
jgi:predicted dehydrogenase